MHDLPYEENPNWKEILDRLSGIRDSGDYSHENVELIRQELQSFDERIRGGATLAAEGCLFEPYILDQVISIAEYDDTPAIRKAAIRSLSIVIHEGVMEGMEDEAGADTQLDEAEEWEEFQTGGLRDDYQRVKNLLFNFLEYEDDVEIQELALSALADLGFRVEIRDKISEFLASERQSAKQIALNAMGKYPRYWEEELCALIKLDTPEELLKEAISASYASESAALAKAITGILEHKNPETLRFAILALANINKTENLPDILQQFGLHPDSQVREAARDAIETFTQKNFKQYMREDLGLED